MCLNWEGGKSNRRQNKSLGEKVFRRWFRMGNYEDPGTVKSSQNVRGSKKMTSDSARDRIYREFPNFLRSGPHIVI